ncbi:MAG TPA: redoxin family protein [Gemmataceae bacterium]|nr:redoxin family protein [Gemmataceae bacterium]
MRAVACIWFLACCLFLGGCGTFGKKTPKEPPPQPAPAWPAADRGASPTAERASPPVVGGLLAGRVLDSFDRPPPPTFIQVVLAQDSPGAKNPILDVATDSQGYFTIHGLQPGQHYQLIARTRDEPKLAGTTWATPPNPRLLIFVSQDFATANTPAVPPPAVPTPKPGGSGTGAPETNRDPAKRSNGNAPAAVPSQPAPAGGAEIGPAMKLNEPAPPASGQPSTNPPAPRTDIRTQDIVNTPEAAMRMAPVTTIPSQVSLGRPPAPEPPSAPARPFAGPAMQVPSCVLTGKQLHNFALRGLDGRPWEYRNHRGRVVLLVFWETTCMPCRAAIPYLKIFQNVYGPKGLEILAIAYEDGSPQEQIQKVEAVRDRLKLNYRLLLGGEVASCPVRTQFDVRAFPTFVLLDEGSRIVYRQQGLEAVTLQELEMHLKSQLGVR